MLSSPVPIPSGLPCRGGGLGFQVLAGFIEPLALGGQEVLQFDFLTVLARNFVMAPVEAQLKNGKMKIGEVLFTQSIRIERFQQCLGFRELLILQ